jgi:penicillin amidase
MKWLRRILVFLLIVVVILAGYGVYLARRSFPTEHGEIEVKGLDASVEVIRDIDGIPHIYAESNHDLYMAQGYVEAQDRFWQMDFWRHIGAGRLAEMFGEDQVETDMFLRSLGFTDLAETELDGMSRQARNVLQWYADGVNAYLAEHEGAAVSLEYAILGIQNGSYEIEPWSPVNTLTWAKVMSWDLSGNLIDELDRAMLSIDLPRDRIEQLYPDYPADHPVIVEDPHSNAAAIGPVIPESAVTALASASDGARSVWSLTGGGFEGIGSNNWVIAGSKTATGAPILANDPHLAIQMPSIWYQVGLHCTGGGNCAQDRVGFTFAGTPGIVVGHNESIAWGVTTQAIDTEDVFVEKLNPDNENQYEYQGQWVDMESRSETIVVAGGEDVNYQVKSTRHGPIISGLYVDNEDLDGADLDLPDDYAVALAWQSLEPSTLIEAILRLNQAADYEDFLEAASMWDIAAQNLIYADTEGNIAYQSTGEVPVRSAGDGRWPVPGWTGEYEWTGLVPFDQMPSILNPESGFIATANQPVTRAGAGPFEGWDGSLGYRGFRINEMLAEADDHTVEDVQNMQMDSWDGGADHLVPFLLDAPVATADDDLIELLRAWASQPEPYQATGDSAGAAAYQVVWKNVLELTFQDELPEWAWPTGGGRWFEVMARLLDTPADPWWDDVKTTAVTESRDDILARAVSAAHSELDDLLGDSPEGWSWGELHIAHFENQTLGQSGIAPIEMIFNRSAPARVSGGDSLVNATGWDANLSYLVNWVPSFRMVVDLDDLSRSTGINTTGQSGHVFSSHYQDMIEDWVDGDQRPLRWTRDQVALDAAATLTLMPPSTDSSDEG